MNGGLGHLALFFDVENDVNTGYLVEMTFQFSKFTINDFPQGVGYFYVVAADGGLHKVAPFSGYLLFGTVRNTGLVWVLKLFPVLLTRQEALFGLEPVHVTGLQWV